MVPAIREFLRANNLQDKVTCIVTFYGVPLRIAQQRPTPAEQEEIADLKSQHAALRQRIIDRLRGLEARARQIDKSYAMPDGEDPPLLLRRAAAAVQFFATHAPAATNPAGGSASPVAVIDEAKFFFGPAGVVQAFGAGGNQANQAELEKLKAEIQSMRQRIIKLEESRFDPQAQLQVRKLVGEGFGAIEQLNVLQVQQDYLQSPNSVAAFDNELALLWWTYYPRTQWQANLLHYSANPAAQARFPRTLMVSRLDAPAAAPGPPDHRHVHQGREGGPEREDRPRQPRHRRRDRPGRRLLRLV